MTAMKFQHRARYSARLAQLFILPNKTLSLAIDKFDQPMFPWAHLALSLSARSSPTLLNPAILSAPSSAASPAGAYCAVPRSRR